MNDRVPKFGDRIMVRWWANQPEFKPCVYFEVGGQGFARDSNDDATEVDPTETLGIWWRWPEPGEWPEEET